MEESAINKVPPSKKPLIDNSELVLKAKEHLQASLNYKYKGPDIKSARPCDCCGLPIVNKT